MAPGFYKFLRKKKKQKNKKRALISAASVDHYKLVVVANRGKRRNRVKIGVKAGLTTRLFLQFN